MGKPKRSHFSPEIQKELKSLDEESRPPRHPDAMRNDGIEGKTPGLPERDSRGGTSGTGGPVPRTPTLDEQEESPNN